MIEKKKKEKTEAAEQENRNSDEWYSKKERKKKFTDKEEGGSKKRKKIDESQIDLANEKKRDQEMDNALLKAFADVDKHNKSFADSIAEGLGRALKPILASSSTDTICDSCRYARPQNVSACPFCADN